jgi:hypothetical protein
MPKPTLQNQFSFHSHFPFRSLSLPLCLAENVSRFFSGFHCVISFIACAKISFTIAIYFPEDFSFTTGDENRNSNGRNEKDEQEK